MSDKMRNGWNRWGAFGLATTFTIVFSFLMFRQHDAFHTRALDLAKFDQAIWNTLHGRFLFSSVQNHSILGNHFSPYMALLSPLFLVWSNVRVLFLVQVVGLAVAGLFLYQIVRLTRPILAPWFLLAFYLNPALHEVTLVEFRRVTLAVPFLALALYALFVRKRRLMVVGLTFALLCKEDIALIALMVGVYLMLFERDWKWGAPLVIVGIAWAIVITLWVIPALGVSHDDASLYPQLNYFGLSGDSYGEILAALLRDPFILFRHMFDQSGLQALWRVFLPLGFVIPLLAGDWLLIVLPTMALMLMSVAPGMHRLEDWYMASVLPGLFAAIAVGLTRLPERRARWVTAALVCMTVIGYALFSPAPLGAKYRPELYRVTAHDRLAAEALSTIPADARVAAQDPLVPHLSHREHIYLYPWISIGVENVEYFVLDRRMNPYPMTPDQLTEHIDNMIADLSFAVEWEADGLYVFHRGAPTPGLFPVRRVVDGGMKLESVEVAVADERGIFRRVVKQPVQLEPGQQLRVGLYWEALEAPQAERTVSVRVSDHTGALVASHDNLPGQGKKPTSWWQKGWQIRDVYYLAISSDAQPGAGSLEVLVYDSFSGQVLPFQDGIDTLRLCDVDLRAHR